MLLNNLLFLSAVGITSTKALELRGDDQCRVVTETLTGAGLWVPTPDAKASPEASVTGGSDLLGKPEDSSSYVSWNGSPAEVGRPSGSTKSSSYRAAQGPSGTGKSDATSAVHPTGAFQTDGSDTTKSWSINEDGGDASNWTTWISGSYDGSGRGDSRSSGTTAMVTRSSAENSGSHSGWNAWNTSPGTNEDGSRDYSTSRQSSGDHDTSRSYHRYTSSVSTQETSAITRHDTSLLHYLFSHTTSSTTSDFDFSFGTTTTNSNGGITTTYVYLTSTTSSSSPFADTTSTIGNTTSDTTSTGGLGSTTTTATSSTTTNSYSQQTIHPGDHFVLTANIGGTRLRRRDTYYLHFGDFAGLTLNSQQARPMMLSNDGALTTVDDGRYAGASTSAEKQRFILYADAGGNSLVSGWSVDGGVLSHSGMYFCTDSSLNVFAVFEGTPDDCTPVQLSPTKDCANCGLDSSSTTIAVSSATTTSSDIITSTNSAETSLTSVTEISTATSVDESTTTSSDYVTTTTTSIDVEAMTTTSMITSTNSADEAQTMRTTTTTSTTSTEESDTTSTSASTTSTVSQNSGTTAAATTSSEQSTTTTTSTSYDEATTSSTSETEPTSTTSLATTSEESTTSTDASTTTTSSSDENTTTTTDNAVSTTSTMTTTTSSDYSTTTSMLSSTTTESTTTTTSYTSIGPEATFELQGLIDLGSAVNTNLGSVTPQGLDVTSLDRFDAQETSQLAFGGSGDEVSTSVQVSIEYEYPSVVLDQSSHILDIMCSPSSITGTIDSSDAFEKAQSAWTNSPLIFITTTASCVPDGESAFFFTPSQVSFDEDAMTFGIFGSSSSLADIATDLTVDFGSVDDDQEPLDKRELSPRAASKYDQSLTLPMTMGPPSSSLIDSPWGWGQALKISSWSPASPSDVWDTDSAYLTKIADSLVGVTNPTPGVDIFCVSCGFDGKLKAVGSIQAAAATGVQKAQIAITGSITAEVHLGVNGFAEYDKTYSQPGLFTKSITGWSIPGIVNMTPKLKLGLEADVTVNTLGQMLTGASLSWSAVSATLDLINTASSKQSGWVPDISRNVEFHGTIDGETSLSLPMTVEFAINILNGKFKRTASLTDTPTVSATADLAASYNVDTGVSGGADCAGISWELGLENKVTFSNVDSNGADDGFVLTDYNVADLADGCLAIGPGGGSGDDTGYDDGDNTTTSSTTAFVVTSTTTTTTSSPATSAIATPTDSSSTSTFSSTTDTSSSTSTSSATTTITAELASSTSVSTTTTSTSEFSTSTSSDMTSTPTQPSTTTTLSITTTSFVPAAQCTVAYYGISNPVPTECVNLKDYVYDDPGIFYETYCKHPFSGGDGMMSANVADFSKCVDMCAASSACKGAAYQNVPNSAGVCTLYSDWSPLDNGVSWQQSGTFDFVYKFPSCEYIDIPESVTTTVSSTTTDSPVTTTITSLTTSTPVETRCGEFTSNGTPVSIYCDPATMTSTVTTTSTATTTSALSAATCGPSGLVTGCGLSSGGVYEVARSGPQGLNDVTQCRDLCLANPTCNYYVWSDNYKECYVYDAPSVAALWDPTSVGLNGCDYGFYDLTCDLSESSGSSPSSTTTLASSTTTTTPSPTPTCTATELGTGCGTSGAASYVLYETSTTTEAQCEALCMAEDDCTLFVFSSDYTDCILFDGTYEQVNDESGDCPYTVFSKSCGTQTVAVTPAMAKRARAPEPVAVEVEKRASAPDFCGNWYLCAN